MRTLTSLLVTDKDLIADWIALLGALIDLLRGGGS